MSHGTAKPSYCFSLYFSYLAFPCSRISVCLSQCHTIWWGEGESRGCAMQRSVLERDFPTQGCCMGGLSWMCLFFNHPNLKSKVALWASSTGSGEAEVPSQRFCHLLHLQQMSTASKRLCFSCRRSPDAWILGGEVGPSLNDSHWAQRKWIHGTAQLLRQRQPKFNLLSPASSSPPACIPQPPTQVQPLPSCGRGLPLAGDTSNTWDLLTSP